MAQVHSPIVLPGQTLEPQSNKLCKCDPQLNPTLNQDDALDETSVASSTRALAEKVLYTAQKDFLSHHRAKRLVADPTKSKKYQLPVPL